MAAATDSVVDPITTEGFTVLESVFDADECSRIAESLSSALLTCQGEQTALRRANGVLYGARNLLTVFPQASILWRKEPLVDALISVLGSGLGLVRGLYFDKPPSSNWSLPWHLDMTVAVRDHSTPSSAFRNPTIKAGVPHVEAADEVLHQMLTLRIHLDDVTDDNGPLQVLPGTHVSRNAAAIRSPVTILARQGDVLAMRPLLSHCSVASAPGTSRHRRVIHLEFAAQRVLPDGYEWQTFIPL